MYDDPSQSLAPLDFTRSSALVSTSRRLQATAAQVRQAQGAIDAALAEEPVDLMSLRTALRRLLVADITVGVLQATKA